jgi:hypothetical protein
VVVAAADVAASAAAAVVVAAVAAIATKLLLQITFRQNSQTGFTRLSADSLVEPVIRFFPDFAKS